MARTAKARTPADLILKLRQIEGWTRVEGDTLETIKKAKALYEITTTRDGWYVAKARTAMRGKGDE